MRYNVDNALAILSRTPDILESFVADLPEIWANCNEGNGTWSAFDIVGHLIHGEKTDWITRIKIVLENRGDKTFEPFDRFAQFEASQGKSLNELLIEFKTLRNTNVKILRSLNITSEDLDLKAIHPELGEVTLKNLLATWVTHDLGHIAQIARVMAKQYKDEVGPWTAYISILNK